VGTKEFNLVFYITSFAPFMRPGIPIVKDTEIAKMKSIEKER